MIVLVVLAPIFPLAATLVTTVLLFKAACANDLEDPRGSSPGAAFSIVGGLGSLVCSILIAIPVIHNPYTAISGLIYLDPLSAFFLITISLVVFLSALYSAGYIGTEYGHNRYSYKKVQIYFIFFGLFSSTMLAALETGNIGLLWVLIEAATLSSAVLVGIEAKPESLEAAWKYVIITSLGMVIALIGILFLVYSASNVISHSDQRLLWQVLVVHSGGLLRSGLSLGFLLAIIGFGTKVGLAPMHTWLPDAHAEAPSPSSAMLSGAILNLGLYAVIRFVAIAEPGLGRGYVQNTLLLFGFLSVTIGVLFMIGQNNFKRLFAYSSIEQMGIVTVALGFGGALGFYGALFQILLHAIAKSTAFLGTGDLVLTYSTHSINKVKGVLNALPVTGGILLVASLALMGSPPFGLFFSELTILRAGFASADPWLAVFLLALLVTGFIAFGRKVFSMILGNPPRGIVPLEGKMAGGMALGTAKQIAMIIPLVIGGCLLLILGLWMPQFLNSLLLHAVKVIEL